jgi:hypothetical protein
VLAHIAENAGFDFMPLARNALPRPDWPGSSLEASLTQPVQDVAAM